MSGAAIQPPFPQAPSPPGRREDILVSVCFADFNADPANADELLRLSRRLAARYRYWEILLIVAVDDEADHDALMAGIGNLRLLRVRHGTPFYRQRVAAASEAIGDVVVLAAIDEQPGLDLIEMIDAAAARGAIVIGQRAQSSPLNPALHALGRSAGFRVNARDMLTAAYPRTQLNQLLAYPDRQLALRFPPADRGIPVLWQGSHDSKAPARTFRELGRRLSLVQKLLISSAPRVLTLVALSSLLVLVSAFAFSLYALVVWLTVEAVQPGWFTVSIVLSLTAAFLGAAILGLSIGLQKVLDAVSADVVDDIVDERSAVDLFGQVMSELNVEVADPAPTLAPALLAEPGRPAAAAQAAPHRGQARGMA